MTQQMAQEWYIPKSKISHVEQSRLHLLTDTWSNKSECKGPSKVFGRKANFVSF